jgi:hypothetical protein
MAQDYRQSALMISRHSPVVLTEVAKSSSFVTKRTQRLHKQGYSIRSPDTPLTERPLVPDFEETLRLAGVGHDPVHDALTAAFAGAPLPRTPSVWNARFVEGGFPRGGASADLNLQFR